MRFSVLIPSYQTETKLLERCLDSIINQKTKYGQKYTDYELILCTEEYPINTMDLLKRYYGINFNHIKLPENEMNVSKARNACLNAAQGDWIIWCDSDDFLQEFALETLEDYIIAHQGKYDCYCYKANIYGEELEYKNTMVDNYVGDYVFTDLIYSNKDFFKVPEVLWRKCISRRFIESRQLRFNDDIALYDDWYFHNILCSCLHSAYKIDKALYNYTIRQDSLSTNSEKEGKRNYIYKVRDLLWEKIRPIVGNSETLLDLYSERLDDYADKFVQGI